MPLIRHNILVFILCLSALFTILLSEGFAEPVLIRFSHVVGENTPKGIGARMFQKLVEERLAGRVRVEIYPASQKYTDEQAILGLLFGDVEMAAPSFTKFRKFTTELQVFDLPFLFEDVEHVHRFQKSKAGQRLLSSMENRGIKGLQYWDNGMRVISADRPLRKPSDLKGLTFRIEPSYVFQQQYSRLGAIATPMPFKRLPDALKVGVVDGYENAWSNILSRKMHLLRPYFTEVGHSYLGYMVVTGRAFWSSLPEDIRNELTTILEEVTLEVNRLAKEKEDADKKVIKENDKVRIISLSDAERQIWKNAMTPVWQKFKSEIDAEILKAALETKNRSE